MTARASEPRMLDAGDFVDEAEREIAEYLARRLEFSELAAEEAKLEAERCVAKHGAIERVMQDGTSYTAAEKKVGLDENYQQYVARQRDVVRRKEVAYALAESAHLRAELAMARFRAETGVR